MSFTLLRITRAVLFGERVFISKYNAESRVIELRLCGRQGDVIGEIELEEPSTKPADDAACSLIND